MSRTSKIRIAIGVLAALFLLNMFEYWYVSRLPDRPMFSNISGRSDSTFGLERWAPIYPYTGADGTDIAYCDVEYNIILVVCDGKTLKPGVSSKPAMAWCEMDAGMTYTITSTDANSVILLSYDKLRGSLRSVKIRASPEVARKVYQAYDGSNWSGERIIDLVISQMPQPEADICRTEHGAIQRLSFSNTAP